MLDAIFRRNLAWAAAMERAEPGYFRRLSAQQRPEFFWIGCSDSRVPANVVAGLDPGEVFVHRNVANVVHSSDMNLLSALEFAVNGLGIREIIVCGHYGCGGVKASCEAHSHPLVEHWIEPIRRLNHVHGDELHWIDDPEARLNRLAELNVQDGVRRLAETPILRQAWENGVKLRVHGLIYGIRDGLLRDLDCTRSGPETPAPTET
jgi:carbonic anhydrase